MSRLPRRGCAPSPRLGRRVASAAPVGGVRLVIPAWLISLPRGRRVCHPYLNVVGGFGLTCLSAVLGSPCQGAGGLRVRARPPARRAAMRHVRTPRPPLRAVLGHAPPLCASGLSAFGLGTAVVATLRFLSAGAVFCDELFRWFPLGAVARGLPISRAHRAPASATPFLSRAGREGYAAPASDLRII